MAASSIALERGSSPDFSALLDRTGTLACIIDALPCGGVSAKPMPASPIG